MRSSRRTFLGGMAMAASGLYVPKAHAQSLNLLDTAFLAVAAGPQKLNLSLWLKVDGLVLNNNDPISTFTDFSGLGRDFTSAGGARPTYLTNQKNGLPAASFDGISNVTVGSLDSVVTEYSMFMVLKMLATAGNPTPFVHGTAGSGAYMYILSGGNRNIQNRFNAAPTNMADGAANTTSFELWSTISNSAPLTAFRVNRADQTLTPNNGAFNIGSNSAQVGAFPGGSLFANMLFCELLVYKAALNVPNRNQTEAYLMAKWGL